jgi:hypothetical protein
MNKAAKVKKNLIMWRHLFGVHIYQIKEINMNSYHINRRIHKNNDKHKELKKLLELVNVRETKMYRKSTLNEVLALRSHINSVVEHIDSYDMKPEHQSLMQSFNRRLHNMRVTTTKDDFV